jgi:hypothetical protein
MLIRWKRYGIIANVVLLFGVIGLYHSQLFTSWYYAVGFILGYLSLSLHLLYGSNRNWLKPRPIIKFLVDVIVPFLLFITITSLFILVISGADAFTGFMIVNLVNIVLGSVVYIVAARQKEFLVDIKALLIARSKQKEDLNEHSGA